MTKAALEFGMEKALSDLGITSVNPGTSTGAHQFGSGPNYLNGVIVTEYKYG